MSLPNVGARLASAALRTLSGETQRIAAHVLADVLTAMSVPAVALRPAVVNVQRTKRAA